MGDYCEIGDVVCHIRVQLQMNSVIAYLTAKKNGIITNFFFNRYDLLEDNDKVFEINKPESKFRLFNTPIIVQDKFNKTENLTWEKVGGNNFWETELNGLILTSFLGGNMFFFTINNKNGIDYIVINHVKKEFDLKQGDKFQILLSNDEVINFTIVHNSYLIYEYKGLGKFYESKIQVLFSDLQKLANFKVENWKLTLQTGQELSGINPFRKDHGYRTFEELQDMIQLLANDYLIEVKKIKNHQPLFVHNEINNNSSESCFLYLMTDTTNGFHKIGISNKPEYREKTLQSEKPSIELITHKKFPSRQIALSIEKALHLSFKDKNIRGEWFNLDQKDVDEIVETLK